MRDLNYGELDPGIRRTVKLLRDAGFETSDSGDGSKAETMLCSAPFPMIAIPVEPAEGDEIPEWGQGEETANKVFELLLDNTADPLTWEPKVLETDEPPATVEYSYSALDGIGVVVITNFSDKDLKNEDSV